MPRQRPASPVHFPLGAALGTQAKVVALRILQRAASPLPHREIVRRSGMAYRSISLALADLLEMGLVEEQAGGRERRVSLQSGHRLAPVLSALFRAEADFYPSLRTELRAIAANGEKDGLLSVAIVGSVATQVERLGDPLELVLVSAEGGAAIRWKTKYAMAQPALSDRFGIAVRLISYELEEARKVWSTRTARAEALVRNSEAIFGSRLIELMESV